MPRLSVNGTELHHEIHGTGPPILLIMGATGDGGHFDALANLLADEFMVDPYDRRGCGRSPVPAGSRTTPPEEQADDAAALLDALGGRSGGRLRHEQRHRVHALSAGPSSRSGAWDGPARAGIVRTYSTTPTQYEPR